jgi:hypothetical protein
MLGPLALLCAQGGAFNLLARKRVDMLGHAHLAIWPATLPLHFAHLKTECTHFCQPGAYQLWTFLLAEVLRKEGLGNEVPTSPAAGRIGSKEGPRLAAEG